MQDLGKWVEIQLTSLFLQGSGQLWQVSLLPLLYHTSNKEVVCVLAVGAAYDREAQTPPVFVPLLWKIL